MQQVIHEFADPPDCIVRELGDGSVRAMALGSVNANPGFLVRIYGSGEVVWVDMKDLVLYGNPGDSRDLGGTPALPMRWMKRVEKPPLGKIVRMPQVREFAPGAVRTKDGQMISFAREGYDARGTPIVLVSLYGRPDPRTDGDWRAATPDEMAQIEQLDAKEGA
jgi:hypothetical protein